MARKAKSFADLLPWGNLAGSGLVFTKQGQVTAGYYFRPPDNTGRTEEEADILSDQVNTALSVLGSGWATWADVVSFPAGRYPAPEASHFPDAFTRAVDDGRRVRFETRGAHFENERALLISYLPPLRQVSKLRDLFFTDGGGKRRATRQQIVETFEKTLREFENRIGGILGLRRMQSFDVIDGTGQPGRQDELVNYLDFCATGRVRGVMLPKSGAFLDTIITGQDAWMGETAAMNAPLMSQTTSTMRPAAPPCSVRNVRNLATVSLPIPGVTNTTGLSWRSRSMNTVT